MTMTSQPGRRCTMARTARIVGVAVLDRKKLQAHRYGLLLASVIPLLGFAIAIWSLWGRGISPTDAGIFLGFYAFTGLGVTVGFHRMLAHRTFDAPEPVRAVLAIGGSMSLEMTAVDWAATHRRHHAYSDQPGDPHSPNLHGTGWRARVRGLWHAHIGWMLVEETTSWARYARDLLQDRVNLELNRLYPVFFLGGLAAPA